MAITFKGGRKFPDPANPKAHLRLANHLTSLTAPVSVDYESKVSSWPMYGNDSVGDCTCAAVGHIIQNLSTYGVGTTWTLPLKSIMTAYEAVSGYKPGNAASDTGATLQDVLNYWKTTGFNASKTHTVAAFASVDPQKLAEVYKAVDAFGHLYVGMNFPQSAMDQFNAGQAWDVVPQSPVEGGHAVNVVGYNQTAGTLQVVTWGRVQTVTLAFWQKYMDEAWVVITKEWFNSKGKDPLGVDFVGLGAELSALTGEPNPFGGA